MDVKFTPQLQMILTDGAISLGIARFQVMKSGADLLAEDRTGRFHISADGFSGSVSFGDGGSLSLKVQADLSAQDQVRLVSTITNTGATVLTFDGLKLPLLELDPATFAPADHIWSLQGAAVKWGQDFAAEVPIPYQRENYLGHLQDAEGGGIPLNYFWKKGLGIALMHIEPVPQEWYLPVTADGRSVTTGLEYHAPLRLHPGDQFTAPTVVISLHHGDFFEPLELYRSYLGEQGLPPAASTPACYEPAWCSWGYGFDIRASEMLGVLPRLDQLGIHWLTLDDRWFDAYGDWNPRQDMFPGGGEELRQMNDRLHQAGTKDMIWWYPLCAEDGHGAWESHRYVLSEVLREHPDWVVLREDGSVARNNRHLAMLCPALPEVQAYTRDLTVRFIQDWGFDGHKLDNIYTMPACHNPAHHHHNPAESVEAFAAVYRMIFDTTLRLKPGAVIQICPCGTPILHSLLPATNQTVTADPISSLQIRQRIKFYKGLVGAKAAVFADHVELSDHGSDFASEIGTGGVPGTKFVVPGEPGLKERLLNETGEYWDLSPERFILSKKWIDLYNLLRPAEGEYLNLYDLAFDFPEAHAIRKGKEMYYAFYAETYRGEIELRGLENHAYQLTDYGNGRELGELAAGQCRLLVDFEGYLLLRAAAKEH